MSLEERILELLRPVAQQIAQEATQAAREELLTQLGAVRVETEPSPRHTPTHCIYPHCNKPHKGPRFTFLCIDHFDLPKDKKQKLLKDWKSAQ